MHTLRGVHYAHEIHMEITRYCLHVIFSQSEFPMQYDWLSQLGFLLINQRVLLELIVNSG